MGHHFIYRHYVAYSFCQPPGVLLYTYKDSKEQTINILLQVNNGEN